MDIIKKKTKTSNIFTVYLKAKDMGLIEFLKEKDVNISMVCRHAIGETAEKFMKGGDEPERKKHMIKCIGKVTINMETNEFVFETQKSFFKKEDFKIE